MTSAADRARRYRARQRAGRLVVSVEVTEPLIESLVAAGWLRPELADCRAAIQAALQRVHDHLAPARIS